MGLLHNGRVPGLETGVDDIVIGVNNRNCISFSPVLSES